MKHLYLYALLCMSGATSITPAFGQGQSQDKIKQKLEAANGTPAFVEFKTNGQAYRSAQATEVLTEHLNLTANDELRVKKTEKDDSGFEHQRFHQYFKKVKVEHGTYTVHSKNGIIYAMNGELKKLADKNTTAAISEKAALTSAMAYIGATTYMWQVPDQEAWAKELNKDKNATFYPTGELVFVENTFAKEKAKHGELVLAWKFDIYAQKPLSRDYVYVDATTGAVVFKDAIIKHATATGTAATRYSGSKTITTDSFNGTFRLRELTRGNGIETYNCKTGTSYSAAVDFTDNDNNWSSAEHNNIAKDNAALDAHWAAQMTYDYFKVNHNRNSYDNAGAKIRSYVHYDLNYENAFWNGSVMTYGDGATRFDPLTSLDVGAHEIGHAVCSYTANLVYSNESGAMNEGFSDIWGAAVEFFAAPGKATWLIGEDIDKQRASLRSMSDPNAEGQPDTYKGLYWYTGTGDNGGVHYNSGVLNHWFYLLSVGKTGTNDLGVNYSVTGIGITDAARIAYRTETVYLTSNSVYADARTYTIQAAIDLFGAGSQQVVQTMNAWNAVGIGEKNGDIAYCASRASNSSYEWISNVQVGAFSNASTGAGYSDFTGKTINVNAGSTNNIILTPGFNGTAYPEYWIIWIDYNKDGDFDDAGEVAFNAGALSSTAVNGSISIPSSATGTTRMRVSMKYNAAPTPCEAFTYGEVEDYTISIASPTTTCAIPGNLIASNISSSSATLNWGAVSGASGYNLRFRPTGTTTWTTSSVSGTSANATGLVAGTAYEYQVSTVCTGSSSAYSASATFTTTTATCAVPVNLATSNITTNSATLSWAAVSGASSYNLRFRTVGTTTWTTANLVGTSANATGLSEGTAYEFQLSTVCSGSSSAFSASATFTTTSSVVCAVPASLIATNLSTDAATLNWGAVVGASRYNVRFRPTGATTWITSSVTGTSTNATGLAAGTVYEFQVSTVCTGSSSAFSASATFTTTAAAICATPDNLAAFNISTDAATLSWGAVSGASSYSLRFRPVGTTTWTTSSLAGTSASATGLMAGTSYEFQVSTLCSGSSSAFSTSVTFTTLTGTVSYCASKGNNTNFEWIDLVEFGGFKNVTGSDAGYNDNTNLTATVLRGAGSPLYVSAGMPKKSRTEFWKVWIDFNQNGSFEDSGELVWSASSSSSGTLNATVMVPASALLGKTRMRVSMKSGAPQTSCETFSHGEVEDYSVNIVNALNALAETNQVQSSQAAGSDTFTQELVVYPNPATSYIQLNLPVQESNVIVISMTGQKLIQKTLKKDEQLDVSSLPAGVYIISVHDGKKEMRQKFVKQ